VETNAGVTSAAFWASLHPSKTKLEDTNVISNVLILNLLAIIFGFESYMLFKVSIID
jgi:hypothetical protein